MHKWAKDVLFFNIPISLSAGLLSFGWTQHIGIPNSIIYGLFNGSACCFLYNSHRFFKTKQGQHALRHSFRLRIIRICSLTIGLLSLYFLSALTVKKIAALFPAIVLAIFYLFPDGKRGLRNISFLKAPIVSLTWTYLLIVIPLVFEHRFEGLQMNCILAFWLFFLALTLPFDTRDVSVDSPQLLTLPMVLGNRKTALLGVLMYIGCWLLLLHQMQATEWKWALSAFTLVLITLMCWPTSRRNNLYYIGLDLMPGMLGILYLFN
jgi:hypothetical protein